MAAIELFSANGTQATFDVPAEVKLHLDPFTDDFVEWQIHRTPEPQAPIELAAQFIDFCTSRVSGDYIDSLLAAFSEQFLARKDVHVAIADLGLSEEQSHAIIRTFYAAASTYPCAARPALFSDSDIELLAIFGGQIATETYMDEARQTFVMYRPLVYGFVQELSAFLASTTSWPEFSRWYKYGLDPLAWLTHPDTMPNAKYMLSSPVSIPMVGLIQVVHLLVAYKTLGMTPGEFANSFAAVTGHSQGISTAAVMAASQTEEHFIRNCKSLLGWLILCGIYPGQYFPSLPVSKRLVQDAMDHEGSEPTAMVSIGKLRKCQLIRFIDDFNSSASASEDKVYLSLQNTATTHVVSGYTSRIVRFVRALRAQCANSDTNQSHVPFSKRKPLVSIRYLAIDGPYHCQILESLIDMQYAYAKKAGWTLLADDLQIPVRAADDGHDIRTEQNLTNYLLKSMSVLPVNWATATNHPGITHIVDFGPGGVNGFGSMTFKNTEGSGIPVICFSALTKGNSHLGIKSDMYQPILKPRVRQNWTDMFSPTLIRTAHDSRLHILTRMSRLLGKPPVMVAGMTPTSANAQFVSAVINAGYHVELAGGGHVNEESLLKTIDKIIDTIAPGECISLNCIYINPSQWQFQYQAIQKLRRRGYPIDSLCIGAGVPSFDVANEIVRTLQAVGLRFVAFKPSTASAIRQVLAIAKANSSFSIALQWTGGRAGGHHSLEDVYYPLVETYAEIRRHENIVLIVGSGLGGISDTFAFISGTWSLKFGYPHMPIDGVLLGSRMLVAKESRTSPGAKQLIINTKGVPDAEWHQTLESSAGGVITIKSEFGESIHVLANRATIFIKELEDTVFSLPREKRLDKLRQEKHYIIERLNRDMHKPWFGKKADGNVADIEDMTYAEVVDRLVELLFIRNRWIHCSHRDMVGDFLRRVEERFTTFEQTQEMHTNSVLNSPQDIISRIFSLFPDAKTQMLTAEDTQYLLQLFRRKGQKPVPFVPVLDEDLAYWCLKDSCWQSEDLDAVIDQDPQRVLILQGPVAVRYSKSADESVKDILDTIYDGQIQQLLQSRYDGDESRVPVVESMAQTTAYPSYLDGITTSKSDTEWLFVLAGTNELLPDRDDWLNLIAGPNHSWLRALITTPVIIVGRLLHDSFIRRILRPRPGITVKVSVRSGSPHSLELFDDTGELVVHIHMATDDTINLYMHFRSREEICTLETLFVYNPSTPYAPIRQIMHGHDVRVKQFYAQVWLDNLSAGLDAIYSSQPTDELVIDQYVVTKEDVHQFCQAIENYSPQYMDIASNKGKIWAPMDFIGRACFANTCKAILPQFVKGDILQLVHLSNSFCMLNSSKQIMVGDKLSCRAKIEAITIEETGKRVSARGTVFCDSKPIAEISFAFFYRGAFVDFENTFRHETDPCYRVHLKSRIDIAVLQSKEWFVLRNSIAPDTLKPGITLGFCLESKYRFKNRHTYSHIVTTGKVFMQLPYGKYRHIADVDFEWSTSCNNPVIDYLKRNGEEVGLPTYFETGGYSLLPSTAEDHTKVTTPMSNKEYANASGDNNPIHTSPYFADRANLPGTITHGMWTSAASRKFVDIYAADNHPERVISYGVSFVEIVLPGDTLKTDIAHVGMKDGNMLVEIQTFNQHGVKVLEGTSEVRQPTTCYVFTGQGSQHLGMGMELYSKSKPARALWDRAEKHMLSTYGISIIDIIRNNPKELTVSFGGEEGSNIRQKYMHMLLRSGGYHAPQPMFPTIRPNTETYTFTSPNGLLNSTQFTQPILCMFEMAAIADMRKRSLLSPNAHYAGHSFGEYSALASIPSVLTVETALDIAFYRGQIMQSSVERDIQSRSPYGMMAVNPRKISNAFGEEELLKIVHSIRNIGRGLLEVVNFNVQCTQYVVAGERRLLVVLNGLLDKIASKQSGMQVDMDRHVAIWVSDMVSSQSATGAANNDIELPRGIAAIPLSNIDIPFHSSFLLDGVDPFRSVILEKIPIGAISYSALYRRYIPNLTGKPFEVSRPYFEMVHAQTKSMRLQVELEKWNTNIAQKPSEVRRLAHVLLIELLAYQFASPVRWIETQNTIFSELKAERYIEIGPASVLCGMARDTLRVKNEISGDPALDHEVDILSFADDHDVIHFNIQTPEPQSDMPASPMELVSTAVSPDAASSTLSYESDTEVATSMRSIADVPITALEVIHTIVCHKLKKQLSEVSTAQSIKELSCGKSTLQNEILGDLQKEFGDSVPDKADDMPLAELAEMLHTSSGKLGPHTHAVLGKLLSAKLPGSYSISKIRDTLRQIYGLKSNRQDGLLLVAITMEPKTRLAGKSEATTWVESVANVYEKRVGISFNIRSSANSRQADKSRMIATINSAEFTESKLAMNTLAKGQMHNLAKYLGVDLRSGQRNYKDSNCQNAAIQEQIDSIVSELGEEFIEGIKGKFDRRKARVFDSYWNWVRQDVFDLVSKIESDTAFAISHGFEQELLNMANRATPDVLSILRSWLSRPTTTDQAAKWSKHIRSLLQLCQSALVRPPVYRNILEQTGPYIDVSNTGELQYEEVPRVNQRSFGDYIHNMKIGVGDGIPAIYMKKRLSSRTQELDWKRTEEYFGVLADITEHGITFAGKTALVTGCSQGSIGAEIVRGLLAGGAQVVATTSSYSKNSVLFFQSLYQSCSAKGSKLIVVPFNQGSVVDISRLVSFVCDKSTGADALGWDLDYVIPFAAIPESGHDMTNISSRSELAHRVMLTNLLRLLGEIKVHKAKHGKNAHCTQVILPMSPNHGDFANTGLYSESKIALEPLFTRWYSESWSGQLTITGAAIGWVRGTGLMNESNLVAYGVEKHGLRTFTAQEMALNIFGLMHPTFVARAYSGPVWAELSGGFHLIPMLEKTTADIRSDLRFLSTCNSTLFAEHALDTYSVSGPRGKIIFTEPRVKPRANGKIDFPLTKTFEDLRQMRYMQGMLNLDKVVVVTGYGEIGPFGHANTRWEIEAFGELSLEGCIELAWIMGLIKRAEGKIGHIGWVEAKSGNPIKDCDIKTQYEGYILGHTGVRLVEPEMTHGYDPQKKLVMRELHVEHDLEPFVTTAEEAADFKRQNGDKVDSWKNEDGSWSVTFLKGAALMVPKAISFDRQVAAQLPTGWSPEVYGIPKDIIDQVDPITCQTLVATVEALMRSGITDPYELYRYVHISEVGSSVGSGIGGAWSLRQMYKDRMTDKEVQGDIVQESLINTVNAYINMLLMSSSGAIKPTVGACGTSIVSIDVAVDTIRSGKAKVMLAGGCDDFSEEGSYEFGQMKATCNTVDEIARGRTPSEMSRPCTSTRSGFVESGGAGIVTLMAASTAIEMGVPIYGIVAMSSTATDKVGRSVPTPGQGILTTAREVTPEVVGPTLDINYRRQQLESQRRLIDKWAQEKRNHAKKTYQKQELQAHLGMLETEVKCLLKSAQDTWSAEIWKDNPLVSPLRASLATWGLTVDDIGVASFHGTSTKANDLNESQVLNSQMQHLGRAKGNLLPIVCQKWLTGHPKGAAAAWMLNGVIQSLHTGVIPGNRNADNIAAELEKFEHLLYLSQSVHTGGIKAGILKSFGFGQVGGEVVVVHPDYLLAAMSKDELEAYQEKVNARRAKIDRHRHEVLAGVRPYVEVKTRLPFDPHQEEHVYLDPLARVTSEKTPMAAGYSATGIQ